MVAPTTPFLSLRGHRHLRYRLLLAIVSRSGLEISGIRVSDADTTIGLCSAERNLIRLLTALVPDARFDILQDGTTVVLRWAPRGGKAPLVPGGTYIHVCPPDRSVAYYAECVLFLAGATSGTRGSPLRVEFVGPGSDNHGDSLTVDALAAVHVPLLKRMGVIALVNIVERAAVQDPVGGRVIVTIEPSNAPLRPIRLVDQSSVSAVRGIAYSAGLHADVATSAADAATALLRKYYTDTIVSVSAESQPSSSDPSPSSAGYALTLQATGPPHTTFSASCTFHPRSFPSPRPPPSANSTGVPSLEQIDCSHPPPENLGVRAARLLLQQISQRGCVDSAAREFVLTLMAVVAAQSTSASDVAARETEHAACVRLGALDPCVIGILRDLKAYLRVEFDVYSDIKTRTIVLTPQIS
ncbi:rRNA-processing endoribonuclease [Thoreauomyces humboldtii]|nr:rRNA-processing endoribonuclease [Thoreauomyces humboldtii]